MTEHAPPRARDDTRRIEAVLRAERSAVRTPLALATAAGAASGLLLIAQAWLLARAIDAVVLADGGLAQAMPFLWPLPALFVARALLATGASAAAFEAGARVTAALRLRAHAHLLALGPAWTRAQRTGEIAATLVDSADAVAPYYATYLPSRVLSAFLPLAILAFVIPTDWVSGLILLLTAPLVPIFMVLIGRGTEALNRAQWRRLAVLSAHVFDAIEGLTTLKLFRASRAEIDAVAAASESYRATTMEVLRVAFLSSLALEFLATLGIAMVAVYIGFRLYYREMHFLPGFAVLLLAPEFYRPLREMGQSYHARMAAIGAADALSALLATPAPAPAPAPAPPGDIASDPAQATLAGPIGTVRFERVAFAWDETARLRDLDFTLIRGHRTVLVGPSGAGKTTITQLLLGFLRPDAGRISIDGVDLAVLPPDAWRARIAWLPQRPTLFAGTIRDNLRLFRPDAAPPEIDAALARAEASAIVARLPAGLDTVLGDRGQGLSGGEIQRIALARLLLARAELVVLDEPAASLDADTAALVERTIATLAHDAAVLVIAHRLETARDADEILLLADGAIVARGRHEALAATSPLYADIMGLPAPTQSPDQTHIHIHTHTHTRAPTHETAFP